MYGFTSKTLAITGVLVAVAALASFLAGIQYSKSKSGLSEQNAQKVALESSSEQKVKSSQLFRSQNANIQAKLVELKDNKLTLKDEKGQQDSFLVASNVVVFEFTDSTKPPKATDLKSIKKDREALIVLQLVNGEYQVSTISYLPETTTPPPPPKP